jgi:signal transduction histidine kinase
VVTGATEAGVRYAALSASTPDASAVVLLTGPDLNIGWLETNGASLASCVGVAVARVSKEDDNEQAMAVLSHEMRTPLTSIKGYASTLLRDDVHWDEEMVHDCARLIDEETNVLTQMISEVLEANAQRSGLLDVEVEPVLLSPLLQLCVRQTETRDPNHRFVCSLPPETPPVMADPVRLRQVVNNLLDNVVKYASPGLVVVSAQDRSREVVVSVADEGPGLRPEHVNRLFERYFRVKDGGGARISGTGLGLPLSRDIIERLGGRIWATSQLGRGTTISFSIPKVETEADGPSANPDRR